MRASRLTKFTVPAGVALALGLTACGGGGYKTKTLHLTEKDTGDFGFADAAPKTKVGKQGPEKVSPGDMFAFRSLLVDGAKPAGELNVQCTATHAGTFQTMRAQCNGTATVPGGQLSLDVAGQPFAGGLVRGAITGGTGGYTGAGGTFQSTNAENAPSKDTFTIQIPQK